MQAAPAVAVAAAEEEVEGKELYNTNITIPMILQNCSCKDLVSIIPYHNFCCVLHAYTTFIRSFNFTSHTIFTI